MYVLNRLSMKGVAQFVSMFFSVFPLIILIDRCCNFHNTGLFKISHPTSKFHIFKNKGHRMISNTQIQRENMKVLYC